MSYISVKKCKGRQSKEWFDQDVFIKKKKTIDTSIKAKKAQKTCRYHKVEVNIKKKKKEILMHKTSGYIICNHVDIWIRC